MYIFSCKQFSGFFFRVTILKCFVFADEDIEIELVEEEPPFLQGHGRQGGLDLSPVKIVKVSLIKLVDDSRAKNKIINFYVLVKVKYL